MRPQVRRHPRDVSHRHHPATDHESEACEDACGPNEDGEGGDCHGGEGEEREVEEGVEVPWGGGWGMP